MDRIRDLGWQGVVGNTDEMLFSPESLRKFASQPAAPPALWSAIEEMATAVREALGEERLAWLRGLPRIQMHGPMALLHGSPESPWRAPLAEASDAELESTYGTLGRPIVVYGHIHRPYIRGISGMIAANTGSAGLPYDGDRRAAYLLLDESQPAIRRVEYDVDGELKALSACRLPHADWVARMLLSACPQMP